MLIEDSNVRHKTVLHVFLRLLIMLLNYIKFLPLIYVFAYIMLSLMMLLVGTNYEQGFFKLATLTLGIKNTDFELDADDVGRLVFIWWFVFGTLFQLVSNLLKTNVSRYKWFLIISVTLLPPTIVLIFRVNNISVPVLLYLIMLASLTAYHILSFTMEKFENTLKKF